MIFSILLFFSSVSQAASVNLFDPLTIGGSASKIYKGLKKRGINVKKIHYADQNGMAIGLLESPGMLAMMNRHQIKHRFFNRLPQKGPLFYRMKYRGYHVVMAFMENKLAATLVTIPREALKATKAPFSAKRLSSLKTSLASLEKSCRIFKPIQKDKYGNTFQWSGYLCDHGGGMKVELHPGEENMLYILYHG